MKSRRRRIKRDIAELRRKIAKAEEATAVMQQLATRTPEDEKAIEEGLEAIRDAQARAEVLERFVVGGVYSLDVKVGDDS